MTRPDSSEELVFGFINLPLLYTEKGRNLKLQLLSTSQQKIHVFVLIIGVNCPFNLRTVTSVRAVTRLQDSRKYSGVEMSQLWLPSGDVLLK